MPEALNTGLRLVDIHSDMEWLDRFLTGRSRVAPFAVALAMIIAIGWIDTSAGLYLSFSLFYMVPIALATWGAGRGPGLILAVLSALTGLTGDLATTGGDHAVLFWNCGMRMGMFVLVVLVLDRLHSALEDQHRLARTDALTGVSNARWFTEVARGEMARASRYRRSLSIAYLDLDDFKAVNDTSGHSAGDELLRVFASTLVTSVRPSDLVARIGGDEFVVLMPESDGESAAAAFVRIRAQLLQALQAAGWSTTCSVGVAQVRPDILEVDELLALADGMMYAAKRGGKDQIASMTASLDPLFA